MLKAFDNNFQVFYVVARYVKKKWKVQFVFVSVCLKHCIIDRFY